MKASDLMVRALEAEGVEYIFGYRATNDGRSGFDNRIQLSLILHFASGPSARGGRGLLDRFLAKE